MAPVHQPSTALGIETCVASVRGSRDLAPTGMRVSMLLCRHESDTCGGQGVLGTPHSSRGTTTLPILWNRLDGERHLHPSKPPQTRRALPARASFRGYGTASESQLHPGAHILGPLFYRGRKDRQESAEHLPGSLPSCPVAQASRRPPDLLHPRDTPPSFRMAGGG